LPQMANGFYLLQIDSQPIGFYAINISHRESILTARTYSYYFVTGIRTHNQRVGWTLELSTGKWTYQDRSKITPHKGKNPHSIVHSAQFQPPSSPLNQSLTIDGQTYQGQQPAPDNFMPELLELLVLRDLALDQSAGQESQVLALSLLSPYTPSLLTMFAAPIPHSAGVLTVTDHSSSPILYEFDRHGSWTGLQYPNNVTLTRTRAVNIRQLFPRQYLAAGQFIQQPADQLR